MSVNIVVTAISDLLCHVFHQKKSISLKLYNQMEFIRDVPDVMNEIPRPTPINLKPFSNL